MESTVPEWITEKYIEAALQHNNEDIIKVNEISVDSPIAKGTNYMSDIYRVEVKYLCNGEPQITSLIIKAPQDSDGMAKEYAKMGITEKEAQVYYEYLPKINEILNKHNLNPITPTSYYSERKGVLILENMNYVGYKMANRTEQLDFNHCKVALETLARFHATSYVLHEREPNFVENIGKDLLWRKAKPGLFLEKMVIYTTKIFANVLKEIPELERFSKRFNDYSDKSWKVLLDCLETKPNEFIVINHGDFWVNNMMFKYDTNQEPEAVKCYDLTGTNYTVPANDLLYFLYTSVRKDVLKTQREELIDIYLKELNINLKRFGSKRFLSHEELHQQIKDRSLYLIFVNVSILPWILADPTVCQTVAIDDLFEKEIVNNPVSMHFKTEPFKSIIPNRLLEIENLTW